jgi:glutamine synthetase type III
VNLTGYLELIQKSDAKTVAKKIVMGLMPQSFKVAEICNKIEEIIPDENWPLPKFYVMLFIRYFVEINLKYFKQGKMIFHFPLFFS